MNNNGAIKIMVINIRNKTIAAKLKEKGFLNIS